jgi:imidazolonepropionase-like amidohydrolase
MQLTNQPPQMTQQANTTKLLVSKLFDPRTSEFVTDRIITVSQDSGLILDVSPYSTQDIHAVLADSTNVDLRGLTVLPGLVDAHVHRAFTLPFHSCESWYSHGTDEA